MLEIENVSKRFPAGNFGVKGLSLTFESGVLGLVGPNGAGKTTLMQMIATVTRPTEGSIRFKGVDIVRNPDSIRARLGYLPQDFGAYDNLTATEFVSYFARLKGVNSAAKVRSMLETVNLHSAANRLVGGFSGGMKQRLGIAQALINDPELLIVDEPTAGLDPEERVRFRNVLSEIGFGKLVILSTHIVSDIESSATEIAIMRQGSLIAMMTPERMLESAKGRVWQTVMDSEDYARSRTRLRVSSAVRRADGVHLRIVSDEAPNGASALAEPNLEDAFLCYMSVSGKSTEASA